MRRLELFTALVAIEGFGKVFITAFTADPGFQFIFYRISAAGTKFCIGRQVFSTVGALFEDKLLMSAVRAKFCLNRHALTAFRTKI
jgi:hypothetical protein